MKYWRDSWAETREGMKMVSEDRCMFWIQYGPCFARVREIKPNEDLVYPLSPNSWKNDYLDE
jgi:hypothetical protein